tara:strand:- start:2576 stop:2785 length:210 start_codon:yes stop_codon:yes gene_type:complete
MSFIFLVYLLFFALVAGAAFAFMWRSMDLVFKELDKPKKNIHPELRDLKEGDELLVFTVKEDPTDSDLH